MNKICTKCNQYKPISEFNIRKDSKIGYSSHCKSCILESRRKRRKKNPEKTKENVLKLCHYTNLQPLWWRDNISKRDKIML